MGQLLESVSGSAFSSQNFFVTAYSCKYVILTTMVTEERILTALNLSDTTLWTIAVFMIYLYMKFKIFAPLSNQINIFTRLLCCQIGVASSCENDSQIAQPTHTPAFFLLRKQSRLTCNFHYKCLMCLQWKILLEVIGG